MAALPFDVGHLDLEARAQADLVGQQVAGPRAGRLDRPEHDRDVARSAAVAPSLGRAPLGALPLAASGRSRA
jgi:hypothetical protein